MTRIFAVTLLLFMIGSAWSAEVPPDEMRPIPAVEAEKRVLEARDALTDVLWVGMDPYWHNGQWDDCVRLCRQIVEIDPTFVEAYTGAAWVLWSRGDDEPAIELFKAAIEANPKSWEAHHDFGTFYYARQRYLEAAEQFRAAASLDAPMVHQHMLPNALEKAGRPEEALQEWRAILERFPDDAVAKYRSETLEKELAPKPGPTA